MADLLERLKAALADRYRIDRELGSGGMATVYLAQDLKHERQVAVKVLRPELAAALGPERFHQEIKIAANLHHPHILPLYDSGDANGFLYYVMPYEEGQSLRDKLAREGELPIAEAVRLLRDVVDALDYAHKHAVVHRDIKPDNVLLSERHALVTDFGVAKAVSEATGAHKLTTEGVALGTPAYMSPEQAAADKHIDHRADIYAVGALAYELLTGRPPFTGTTPQEVLSAQVTQAPEPVTKYRTTVPPALAQIVMKCLEKKAADRWQSAEELLSQFEVLATPSGGLTPTGTMPVHRAAKRRWMMVGAGAAVFPLVVLGLALWQPWASEEVATDTVTRAWTILAEVEGSASQEIRDLVKSLLAGDIDASGSLRTLQDDQIRLGLSRAMKPDTTRVTQSVASELAERGRIGTVFAPELDRVGDTYALTVRVLDAEGDSVLATERASAADDNGLIPASREVVEGLVPAVSAWMGGEVSEFRANPPATFSMEAFRRREQAKIANDRGRYHEAIALCREALAIDADFASCWMGMGGYYSNAGFPDSAAYARREALKHPERLSVDRRLQLEALLADDWVTRLQRSERQYRETGDGAGYAHALADGFGRYEEAVAVYEAVDEQSPFGLRLLHLSNWVGYLLALGRVEEAESLAVRLEGTDREVPFKTLIALRKEDWAEAERLAMEVARDPALHIRWRSDALRNLASARTATGRIHAAVTTVHELIELNQQSGRADYHTRSQLDLLVLTRAAELIPQPWRLAGLQGDTTERARAVSGLWAAELGDTALAQSYLDGLPAPELGESDAPSVQGSLVAALHARLAGLRQQWDEAVGVLEPVTGDRSPRTMSSTRLPNWIRAEAEEELGHAEQAARLYAEIAGGYRFGDYEVNAFGISYSFAHRKAALLYAQLEDYDRAEEHWLAFLDAFSDPDPEFEWMVEEARRELERLGRGR